MKFAIVSDTHDNIINFNKAVDFLNKENISVILHCGDICTQETINQAVKNFKGEIKFVRGNCDYSLDYARAPILNKIGALPSTKIENFSALVPQQMEVELGGPSSDSGQAKKIVFVHFPEVARRLAESGKYDLVFYGHTHRPWLDRRSFSEGGEEKTCLLINPGELAGQIFKPTFAIYDTESDKLELKILEKI